MLHQKPSLAKWQQTSVIAKTPALFIDVGERNALLQISIMDKLSSLQRELLSFIFSGRNSIMFLGLVRCPRLLENNALILYADPIFTVHFPIVRGKQSPQISLGRGNTNRIRPPDGFSFGYFWYFMFQKTFMFSAADSHTKPEKSSMCYGQSGSEPGGQRPACLLVHMGDPGHHEDFTLIKSLNFNEARSAWGLSWLGLRF